MKKTYSIPTIEVVDIKMTQSLLTGSVITIFPDEATDPSKLLAPGMPNLPGVELPGLNLPGMNLPGMGLE